VDGGTWAEAGLELGLDSVCVESGFDCCSTGDCGEGAEPAARGTEPGSDDPPIPLAPALRRPSKDKPGLGFTSV